jgi:hypothetical protein
MSFSEKFQEAFERFEDVVDVDSIDSFGELRSAFSEWAGYKWKDTGLQLHALSDEARRLGLLPRPVSYRIFYVNVRGKPQERWRDNRTGRFIKRR